MRSRKAKSTSRNSSPKKWVLWLSLKVIQVALIFVGLYVYLFILCRHDCYYELLLITVGLIVSSIFFKQPYGVLSTLRLFVRVLLYQLLIWLANQLQETQWYCAFVLKKFKIRRHSFWAKQLQLKPLFLEAFSAGSKKNHSNYLILSKSYF